MQCRIDYVNKPHVIYGKPILCRPMRGPILATKIIIFNAGKMLKTQKIN
jgi:hypothetical protein